MLYVVEFIASLCKIENLKAVTSLEAFQMLCRDLYLPFTAVLTVAGLSQRNELYTNFFLNLLQNYIEFYLLLSQNLKIQVSVTGNE